MTCIAAHSSLNILFILCSYCDIYIEACSVNECTNTLCDYDIYLHTKNPRNQIFVFDFDIDNSVIYDFEYCTEKVGALVNRARALCKHVIFRNSIQVVHHFSFESETVFG